MGKVIDLISRLKQNHKDISGKNQISHVDVDDDGSIGMQMNSVVDLQAMLQTYTQVATDQQEAEISAPQPIDIESDHSD
jgi:hypothetical protein